MEKDVICQRVKLCEQGKFPFLIHEFQHSFFVLGDHQFYKGYSLLYLKKHIRELHEIPKPDYLELCDELYQANLAIQSTFKPWKLNVMSVGNQTPHIHWHIIPRYNEDVNKKELPMYEVTRGEIDLADYETTLELAQDYIKRIKSNLEN